MTTITKKYKLINPTTKELINTFDDIIELSMYVKENLSYYVDYIIEEETTIRNFY